MIHGLDTSVVVASELAGHARHEASRVLLERLSHEGGTVVLAPQVLAEFVHIVTDPRRCTTPLHMSTALERAELIWNGRARGEWGKGILGKGILMADDFCGGAGRRTGMDSGIPARILVAYIPLPAIRLPLFPLLAFTVSLPIFLPVCIEVVRHADLLCCRDPGADS